MKNKTINKMKLSSPIGPVDEHYRLWSSIEHKAKNGIADFSDDEKEVIIERVVDSLQVELWHKTDEGLLEYIVEKGVI